MIFKEFGDGMKPAIVLLHGGGLSWWSWKRQIEAFQDEYFVIVPITDGHGDASDIGFTSIEESAVKVIEYVDRSLKGRVFALCGLSLGAQIAVEILSKRNDITQYAVIESALVCPIRNTVRLSLPMLRLCYGLIRKQWYSKLQAKAMKLPEDMYGDYYRDSIRISKETLINMTKSNGCYEMPGEIAGTSAKTLILAGEKELPAMKKSAELLHRSIPGSSMLFLAGMNHGEISLAQPDRYIELLRQLFKSGGNTRDFPPVRAISFPEGPL